MGPMTFPRGKGFQIALLILLVGALALTLLASSPKKPTNVILFIGDGMGVGAITAAMLAGGQLHMQRMTFGGLSVTFPAGDEPVTDSAAGATAYATGHRTQNGMIAVAARRASSSSVDTLGTILEKAAAEGKSTGLVVTCRITHATPACFAAHVGSRGQETEIALQMAAHNVNVLFGGGRSYFLPRSQGGKRDDERNLIDEMKKRGYADLQTPEQFQQLAPSASQRVLGLFYPDDPPVAGERRPSLPELTKKALEILSRNSKGFFLMVEGSQIDWRAHENRSDSLLAEVKDFDAALGAVMDFAEEDGRTLVVVTADHETGGYAIIGGSQKNRTVKGKFMTHGHTAAMVPLLAYGPGAEQFGGILENAVVGQRLMEMIGK